MVDMLSSCLDSCTKLTFDRIQIDCKLFDNFRCRIFQLLRRYEGESENTFKRNLRKRLWRFVIDLSNTPLTWDRSIEEHLELESGSFRNHILTQYGKEFTKVADEILQHWSHRMSERFTNPIYAELADTIRELRDTHADFRILATKRERKNYLPLLAELDLLTQEVFCSPALLKSVPSFDCLVTCGPYREDVDSIFTAPRYKRVVNVRWSRDNDVPGFPNYMVLHGGTTNAESMFPADFPVRVRFNESTRVIETIEDEGKLDESDNANPIANWNFDDFESLFVRRNRLRRTTIRSRQNRGASRSQPTHSFAAVQLTFIDGSYWSLAFDQLNKPPLVYSIDKDGDNKPTKRRAALEEELPTDQDLLPGMLVVVEPPPTSALREMALEKRAVSQSHLTQWKANLREAVEQLGSVSLKFKFQTLRHPIENIEAKMQRWISRRTGINAPQDYETFSVVVGKFAGYEDVDEAWEEVLHLRGASIQDGRIRENNIDEYLLSSVLANFQQLIDEPRTEIAVEGFEEPAVVIELSSVEFFLEGQLSQLGRYRRTEDLE